MDIDIKDIITLSDDNEYVVASKINYQDSIYYYLIDKDNNKNLKFCVEKLENQSLIEVEDKNLIQKLLPLFLESSIKAIAKEDLALLEQDADWWNRVSFFIEL